MSRLDKFGDDNAYGVHFFGDAAEEAQNRLTELKQVRNLPVLRESNPSAAKAAARKMNLQWEPLEVLLDIINDESTSTRTVGGVPQIIQIYQYGEAESFVWQSSDGRFYFGGRPVLPQERFDRRVMRMIAGAVDVSFSDLSMTNSRNPDGTRDGD